MFNGSDGAGTFRKVFPSRGQRSWLGKTPRAMGRIDFWGQRRAGIFMKEFPPRGQRNWRFLVWRLSQPMKEIERLAPPVEE